MIRSLKFLTITTLIGSFTLGGLFSPPAYAQSPADQIRSGVNTAAGKDEQAKTRDATSIVRTIINILSVVIGAVAVIMIIYGGFRYVTSAGNDSTVSSAKNTILYAVIGLIIVAFAQVIVRFVLTSADNNATGSSSSSSSGGLTGSSSPPSGSRGKPLLEP